MEELRLSITGQWELVEKSNYGPARAGLYNTADNAKRKMNNTGKVFSSSTNSNVKEYTSNIHGTAASQAAAEARIARNKSKNNPVKVLTPEERAKFVPQTKPKLKLVKQEELTMSKNGQWMLR